jgi:hypothetical protein
VPKPLIPRKTFCCGCKKKATEKRKKTCIFSVSGLILADPPQQRLAANFQKTLFL